MTELILFDGQLVSLRAAPDGLLFDVVIKRKETDEPLRNRDAEIDETTILADLRILQEQGLASKTPHGWSIRPEDWPLGIALGVQSLTAFTKPSHLLLEVGRVSELGRSDFRYVVRWREGHREVSVERFGPYVRHTATGRVMHLDGRTVELVEAMEQFNARTPEAKTGSRVAWESFATVSANARSTGALLDDYLRSNTVLIPTTIGLTIREHNDGSISFEPRLPELTQSSDFTATFMNRSSVPDVTNLQGPDGQRYRILFSEEQKEVLRRMQSVRKITGEEAGRLRSDPVQIFDGVADAIDLSDVQMEYGPRVIGIGTLTLPSNVRADDGPTMIQRLGIHADTDANISGSDEGAASSSRPTNLDSESKSGEEALRRTAVAIDVMNVDTNASETVRLSTELEVEKLRSAVEEALSVGATELQYNGRRILAEPALAEALRNHGSREADEKVKTSGSIGKSGHLYLLINEHEDSLTDALLVPTTTDTAPEIGQYVPNALMASVSLKPHQDDGIRWLATTRAADGRRGAILADDMGLGKTLQLLAHIARLIESGSLNDDVDDHRNGPWRPVLIIAPLLLVESGTWTKEMKLRFDNDGAIFEPWVVLRDEGIDKVKQKSTARDHLGKPLLDPARLMAHKVVITTYETLVAYQHSLAQRIDGKPLWSLVIFDEAQEVKSPSVKQSYAAKALDARFKIAATGTPVETRLRDLWNLLDTVEPTVLGTQRDFVIKYERPAQNANDFLTRRDALDQLRAALRYQKPAAFLLRRDKSILDLPPKHEHRPQCAMTDLERRTTKAIMESMAGREGARRPLDGLQKLHLASQHPVLAGADGNLSDTRELVRTSSRLQSLIRILENIRAAGEKALIFARSVPAQRMLSHVIGEVFDRQVDVVNGQTGNEPGRRRASASSVRREMLDTFCETPGFGVIVLSPFVAGVGLTLIQANHVIHYGRWWNPAIESQATDRAYRIGQDKPVNVYFPIAFDANGEISQTFDQALDALILSRRELANDFLSPRSDESDGAALFNLLREIPESSRDSQAISLSSLNCERLSNLICIIAEHEGTGVASLGVAGHFGAHLLKRRNDGCTAIRIVEAINDEELAIARAARESWQVEFSDFPVDCLLVVRDLGSTRDQMLVSWMEFVKMANTYGISAGRTWLSPVVCKSPPEARSCLGL